MNTIFMTKYILEVLKKDRDKYPIYSEAINNISNFKEYTVNNPVIHDSYGDFYVYKYITKSFSVRILYRYNTMLEIHKFHFKKGDRDNSK